MEKSMFIDYLLSPIWKKPWGANNIKARSVLYQNEMVLDDANKLKIFVIVLNMDKHRINLNMPIESTVFSKYFRGNRTNRRNKSM